MSEFKLDFFNIEYFVQSIFFESLKKTPHQLMGMFQNEISSFGDLQQLKHEETLLLNGIPAAKIKLREENKSLFSLLQAGLQSSYEELLLVSNEQKRTLLLRDFEETINSSDNFDIQLQQLLRFSRAHLMVEECGVFAIEDGFSIEGIKQLGYPTRNYTDAWKQEYSAAVAATVSTKSMYLSTDIEKDKLFNPRETGKALKNFLCFPLLKNDSVIGALYFSNKLLGDWSEDDKVIAQRFARTAATIVEKYISQNKIALLSKTSDHLGKYLSKKVVKNVKNTEKVEIGGIEKKVVCLFADIRSFTTITEGIPAATLVKLLNFHFEQMSPIIDKYEGTLDKIVGDLIMAVWNIPHDQPEPELLAMNCAIDMQKEMKRVVVPEWQRHGVKTMGMGIGVNAGLAVAGNLGSSRFMNYTVVGDTINTAQRLESRAAIGEIWMAESILPAVDGKIEKYARKENNIKLKGKDDTVSAYVYRPLSY